MDFRGESQQGPRLRRPHPGPEPPISPAAAGRRSTKDALNREAFMDLDAALQFEAEAQAELMLHPNFREAYDAFVEKRKPRFTS